jgi:transcriptional regulator with GAF, ATPase, and Fis domain
MQRMPPRTGSDSTRVRTVHVVVRYAKVRVEVVSGADAGKAMDLAGQSMSIGTAEDNDLVLADATVSRHHCELEAVEGGIRVRDAGSTNGVFLGGARIYDAMLPYESRLRLGDTELAVHPLGETIEREQTTSDRFGDLLGLSPRMRELFADLERIAATDITLLVEGETGTGKELVAESVHRAGGRCDAPFVVFDCGAVSPTLVESELFGHERGAFTGATHDRKGVFEQAEGGTVFFDEIGELPKDLQPKLLRALENRTLRRVGGTSTVAFDVRVIAATNRHLAAEVGRGVFRQDLYFRLAAAHVVVPPLRERMEDLELLVQHFMSLERPPRSADEVPEHVWALLRSYRWPGNVRELRNVVQRLLVTPDRPWGGASHSQAPPQDPAGGAAPTGSPGAPPTQDLLPLRVARREANDAFERSYVAAVYAKAGGSVTRAATLAEVSRQLMQKLLKKHGR